MADTMTRENLFLYLRKELIDSFLTKNTERNVSLFHTFTVLNEAAYVIGDPITAELTLDFLHVSNDEFTGGPWESTMPSEEKIQHLYADD